MVGKGSVRHNERKFNAINTDPTRSCLNTSFINKDIKDVYHELFDKALQDYNAKQNRPDRRIDDYYKKIVSGKQEKPFHEVILQIGNKDDMNAETEEGRLAEKILTEYIKTFQERNPNLRVFSAHLHMDEATPHLHIDFVPFTTGSKRGLETRVSLKQALAKQGFKGGTRGDTEWNQWVLSEKEELSKIMERYGVEWEQKGTHEKHLSVLDYEKKMRSQEVETLTEEIARILQENKVMIPMAYWQSKGLNKGGKKTQPDPYKWCKTTVQKILAQQEYCGDVINFKTYSKNFKNKKRLQNPEENWKIFKDIHEPIIDRNTFETVQKMKAKGKRRAPNPEHAEKNMFCGLLYCADCGSPLWFNVNHPNTDIKYFMCSNYKGRRGTCEGTHYVRADSLEQIVMLEFRSLASFLVEDEEAFADILEAKTNKSILKQQKFLESSIDKSVARTKEIAVMYEKLFEKHINGIVNEESFMQLSQKYETERDELKLKIRQYQEELSEIENLRTSKEQFTLAVRKFMQMETLTPALLNELIEKIEVHSIEGKGKNKTQRIVIHYRFIGVIENPVKEENIVLEARQGVAVEYLTA